MLRDQTFDTFYSGCTSVTILLKDDELICANVGDSRAIIGRKRSGMDWSVVSITRDHKGTEEDESNRIIETGGRLEAFKDEDGRNIGPIRVWLRHTDSPGNLFS